MIRNMNIHMNSNTNVANKNTVESHAYLDDTTYNNEDKHDNGTPYSSDVNDQVNNETHLYPGNIPSLSISPSWSTEGLSTPSTSSWSQLNSGNNIDNKRVTNSMNRVTRMVDDDECIDRVTMQHQQQQQSQQYNNIHSDDSKIIIPNGNRRRLSKRR